MKEIVVPEAHINTFIEPLKSSVFSYFYFKFYMNHVVN